jgi:hypothetical protein
MIVKVKGELPEEFFNWFTNHYKKSKGKEAEMLSRVDIWVCD